MRALIFALSITAIHASTIYSVTDLSSMGGSSAAAFGIDTSGTAVGWAENAIGSTITSRSALTKYQDLGALPAGDWSAAYGFTKSGEVADYGDIASVSTIRNEEQ